MGRNEKTSKRVAKVASKLLKTGKGTPAEIRKVAGSDLTQTKDKPKQMKKAVKKK